MNFTAKDEYGIKAVMYLAQHSSDGPIQAREIASSEGMPEQFLEQVLSALRKAEIIRSIRGASGGYEIARSAQDITAGDIIRVMSGPIVPVLVHETGLPDSDKTKISVVEELWRRVQIAISDVIDNTTIQDLVDEKIRRDEQSAYMMYI